MENQLIQCLILNLAIKLNINGRGSMKKLKDKDELKERLNLLIKKEVV
jgi:hypothetical protein